MYLPVLIDDARWESVTIPELLTAKAERFVQAYGIEKNYAIQLASSKNSRSLNAQCRKGSNPNLRHLPSSLHPLNCRREGVDIRKIPDQAYLDTWHAVDKGQAAKEAIPEIFRLIAAGSTFTDALAKLAPAVSREDLEINREENYCRPGGFCRPEREWHRLGPLMGVVMAEVRGSVDGKIVSEILKKEITATLAAKKP